MLEQEHRDLSPSRGRWYTHLQVSQTQPGTHVHDLHPQHVIVTADPFLENLVTYISCESLLCLSHTVLRGLHITERIFGSRIAQFDLILQSPDLYCKFMVLTPVSRDMVNDNTGGKLDVTVHGVKLYSLRTPAEDHTVTGCPPMEESVPAAKTRN